MAQVTFNNKKYQSHEGETILECLLRHKIDYPCACQSGICQSCMAHLAEGELDPSWQKGLKDALIANNYFLTCLAKPDKNITFELPGLADIASVATIKQIRYFNKNVICLWLVMDQNISWTPGQYVNLINPNGCRRSYSIANIPEVEGYVELHIKLKPGGLMSEWLSKQAYIGCEVHLQGPIGECFYVNLNDESFPMVLAGTGTGLAPLLAIIRDALRQQHKGKIHLIHGGVCAQDLYLDEKLTELAQQHEQLIYESCVLQADGLHQQASIDQVLLRAVKSNDQTRVYICGPEATTKKLKTTVFLAGIASSYIYSDTFI